MRRDKKWLTHAAPRGFKLLPERTRRRPDVKATRGDGTYWVNLYRKIRGKNLWVKRTAAEIDAAFAKTEGIARMAYLRNVELPALAH
jgi:hypothetical protein